VEGSEFVPQITLLCGLLLIAVGLFGYLKQEPEHASLTALIPAALGAVFLVLGAMSFRDQLRKHAMHLAAALGLLGFLAALGRLLPKVFRGDFQLSLATICLALMALICAVFVGLCVNSFVQARRQRGREEVGKP
jgi:uncharacterized membrane protein